ncbi:MAG: S41 family peptidase [Chloroherpetonaceae bacterium]|nr:S41 family peptidase [Chloroherpetonaceae bacterium]
MQLHSILSQFNHLQENQSEGYYRYPALFNDHIIFTSEDDLWKVSTKGGVPQRLTAGLSECTFPVISEDGKWIAFTAREEGQSEIYVMPFQGGSPKRLTYLAATNTRTVGWRNGKVLFLSSAKQPFKKIMHAYFISPEGGEPEAIPFGHMQHIAYDGAACIIGRGTADTARWKRYKGGTSGDIWLDDTGNGEFKPFTKLFGFLGNFVSPFLMKVNGVQKAIFISDHEGIGNLYAADLNGKNIKRLTHHTEYFARFASPDSSKKNSTVIYHAGGDIYLLNVETEKVEKIIIDYNSPRTQKQRKFVSVTGSLDSYALSHQGNHITVTSRGKSVMMHLAGGPILSLGNFNRDTDASEHSSLPIAENQRSSDFSQTGRIRLTSPLAGNKFYVTISDASGEERLELLNSDNQFLFHFKNFDIGRAITLASAPSKPLVAITNHRQEIILIHIDTEKQENSKLTVVARSDADRIYLPSFSPDSRYIAYNFPIRKESAAIEIYDIETAKRHQVTRPIFHDFAPQFCKDGNYLYFLSNRIFNPVYDNLQFDLNFTKAVKPYLITLHKEKKAPFFELSDFSKSPAPEPVQPQKVQQKNETPINEDNQPDESKQDARKAEEEKPSTNAKAMKPIDFEGIEERITEFPIEEARFGALYATKNGVILWANPVRGALQAEGTPSGANLYFYKFEGQKYELIAANVHHCSVSGNGEVLVYGIATGTYAVSIGELPDGKQASARKAVPLAQMKVLVSPAEEWRQMFREAWRLQRDQFWTPDMSGVRWLEIFKLYYPLTFRINTRTELSDLIWEMQGELGTSHCYEWGGDYRQEPKYLQGFLGADVQYNTGKSGYEILSIPEGDHWDSQNASPLKTSGVNLKEGDIILAINGDPAKGNKSLGELLLSLYGQRIYLKVANSKGENIRTVEVKTLKSEELLRYRDWVNQNRRFVKEKSNGKLGYVHIPNMQAWGYSEFHRAYLTEYSCDGLIVDVRYNGGGHVSQLLLEKLMRKRLGYDVSRWSREPEPYFSNSVNGPMLCLTNEFAGSDGDIFSHSFKMLKLGKLVGKRTWGGVIGIYPRHSLSDGTVTTQPEFSFWFNDVGWQVENYGTDPDVTVEVAPQDFSNEIDLQLNQSIEILLQELKQNPPFKPNLKQNDSVQPELE